MIKLASHELFLTFSDHFKFQEEQKFPHKLISLTFVFLL